MPLGLRRSLTPLIPTKGEAAHKSLRPRLRRPSVRFLDSRSPLQLPKATATERPLRGEVGQPRRRRRRRRRRARAEGRKALSLWALKRQESRPARRHAGLPALAAWRLSTEIGRSRWGWWMEVEEEGDRKRDGEAGLGLSLSSLSPSLLSS